MEKITKLIAEYLAATKNEIRLEDILRKGIIDDLPKIPRAPKWLVVWNKSEAFVRVSFYLLFFLWIFGGFFLFFLRELISLLLRKKKKVVHSYVGRFYVSFSDLNNHSVLNEIADNTVICIKMPWIDLSNENAYQEVYEITDLMVMKDYIKAFFCSILSFFFILIKGGAEWNGWILQTYTVFKWFCARIALDKLDGEFITTAHFDRWAVLMDRLCLSKKAKLTLVQHGSVRAFLLPENAHFKIYTRLHSVVELITFDELEREVFFNKIIRRSKNRVITSRIIGMRFQTDKIENTKFSILFVGHPLCEASQIVIFNSIYRPDCLIYYKGHPKASPSEKAKSAGWLYINDPRFFPDVDLVISYASTLAYEYESIGTKVLFHDLSTISENMCSNIVSLIKEEVKNNERKYV